MEDKKCSDFKKMEGDDGLNTVECLRGRLLAERQASRVAKEEAELMGNKLAELEKKLGEETKLRRKAEKRLRFLKKKLESLKISPAFEALEQSSFEIGAFSSSSSASTSDDPKDPKQIEPKSQTITQLDSQHVEAIGPESSACTQNHSTEESSSTQDTPEFNSDHNLNDAPLCSKSTTNYQDSKAEDQSDSSSKASEANTRNESETEEEIDNSLALVPVSLPAPSKASELKIVNRSVSEVLDALRHAREKIQSSMEGRHMIRAGPA